MDEGRPNKLQLLGEKLVAWKDSLRLRDILRYACADFAFRVFRVPIALLTVRALLLGLTCLCSIAEYVYALDCTEAQAFDKVGFAV